MEGDSTPTKPNLVIRTFYESWEAAPSAVSVELRTDAPETQALSLSFTKSHHIFLRFDLIPLY